MKTKTIQIQYSEIEDWTIDTEINSLCHEALTARENSHAPYSKFQVGAAVELDNQKVYTGSNIENQAFPSGSCAERVAINHALHTSPNSNITRLAICGGSTLLTKEPISPCGNCRQLINEVLMRQNKDFDVIMFGNRKAIIMKASDLLPLAFRL